MATPATAVLSKATLQASREWLALTDHQRRWIELYLSTNDATAAAREVYGEGQEPKYVMMIVQKLLTSRKVIDYLALAQGWTPKQRFLHDLQNTAAHTRGVAHVEALRLLAKVSGFLPDESNAAPTASAHRYSVGEKVSERDGAGNLHIGIVKSINAHGQPVEITEVQA